MKRRVPFFQNPINAASRTTFSRRHRLIRHMNREERRNLEHGLLQCYSRGSGDLQNKRELANKVGLDGQIRPVERRRERGLRIAIIHLVVFAVILFSGRIKVVDCLDHSRDVPSAPVLQHQERKRVRREARPWFLGSSSDLWQEESGLSDCRVKCGVWSWRWNSGTLHIMHSDRGVPQTKTADVNERTTGGPVPTREDRGVRRNGPRRRAARLRVLSSEPIGARTGPRELELQAASAPRLAELQLS